MQIIIKMGERVQLIIKTTIQSHDQLRKEWGTLSLSLLLLLLLFYYNLIH